MRCERKRTRGRTVRPRRARLRWQERGANWRRGEKDVDTTRRGRARKGNATTFWGAVDAACIRGATESFEPCVGFGRGQM